MEVLSHNIAELVGEKLNYDSDKKEVIAYGLSAFFQMSSIFIITSIIGLVGGFWVESMVIFLAVGLLRKSTGGAHSQTFQGCLIISIFSISIMSLLSSHLLTVNSLSDSICVSIAFLLAFGFFYFLVYKLSPIDSPSKPIVRKEKIEKLRRTSINTVIIYLLITETFLLFSSYFPWLIKISIALCFATLWQVFTLTKSGHKLIELIDSKFSKK